MVYDFKVKKEYLLLIACLVWTVAVWTVAGMNIVRIGFRAYPKYLTIFHIFLAALVFFVFQFLIFGKLVRKHTKRILAYKEKQWFFKFFDRKSFVIMLVMMTGGLWLRSCRNVSERFIAVFYSGLGMALLLSGILFGLYFFKVCFAKCKRKSGSRKKI